MPGLARLAVSTKNADAILGMTARSYKNGGANEEIRYAVTPCKLGIASSLMIVAATVRGVCAIEIGIRKAFA